MTLSGRTVLVTGGSSGIGLALAEGFAARGNRVLVCGRNEEHLRLAQRRVPDLEAPIQLTAQFLPHLLRRAGAGRSPASVNITSGPAYVTLAATPVYGATKAGLQAFTKALRFVLPFSGARESALSAAARPFTSDSRWVI